MTFYVHTKVKESNLGMVEVRIYNSYHSTENDTKKYLQPIYYVHEIKSIKIYLFTYIQ